MSIGQLPLTLALMLAHVEAGDDDGSWMRLARPPETARGALAPILAYRFRVIRASAQDEAAHGIPGKA
jgi:hypothetical protein